MSSYFLILNRNELLFYLCVFSVGQKVVLLLVLMM